MLCSRIRQCPSGNLPIFGRAPDRRSSTRESACQTSTTTSSVKRPTSEPTRQGNHCRHTVLVRSVSTRRPPSPPPVGKLALVLGVELAPEQRDDRQQIHPYQQRDTCADASIENVVVGNVSHVPAESGRDGEPGHGRQHSASPHATPALRAVRAEV